MSNTHMQKFPFLIWIKEHLKSQDITSQLYYFSTFIIDHLKIKDGPPKSQVLG